MTEPQHAAPSVPPVPPLGWCVACLQVGAGYQPATVLFHGSGVCPGHAMEGARQSAWWR